MNHKIEKENRGGHCVNEGCTLNLTFISSIDITYLENNDQCPTGPLKKLMRQPTDEEIVGDHSKKNIYGPCPENIEVLIDGVVHPNDTKPSYYNHDCYIIGPHTRHRARTWNLDISIEWTDGELVIHHRKEKTYD